MDEVQKKDILESARSHIRDTASEIKEYESAVDTSILTLREKLAKGDLEDPEVIQTFIIHRLETKKQLSYAYNTPYFVRCDVQFEDESVRRVLYFGRFPFTRKSIYSWIAPAASIRFSSPGRFVYTTPNGKERSGELFRKDQYLIIDRRIVFLSSEATDYERELIYQEYFSEQRKGFALPEIVEQMEQAQDTIIRSHHAGSFLIAGAAGSGKTTLALHRVAYLVQSPETAELFPPQKIIVFVQDQRTKAYFSQLLPELGIYRVQITTFDEWALRVLGLSRWQCVLRIGEGEEAKDAVEYAKHRALTLFSGSQRDKPEGVLSDAYADFLSPEQKSILSLQLSGKLLDRYDLSVLLKQETAKAGGLTESVEKYVKQQTSGRYVKKQVTESINYALVVIDEAENYLTEQISVLKSCVNQKTNAVIYVGDLAQRTHLFTITSWDEVGEEFDDTGKVMLKKIYRNTKQVLTYIQSVGFTVVLPEKLREGDEVVEKRMTPPQEVVYIKDLLPEDATVGILAKTTEHLKDIKKAFAGYDNVHVLTINEAQGVEFDTVFLVGVSRQLFQRQSTATPVTDERRRVDRDLLYVALTRAVNRLFVLGEDSLKTILA